MPRLLLVARNPGLAFGLGSASDDIIEVRPSLVGRLEISPGMADVVVIEQERPDEALTTLDMLRAGGLMAPALLVASARPEWADFDPSSRPSVSVLDPPITQDRLGQSVGSTSGLPAADLRAADLRAADLPAADLRAADLRAPDLGEPGGPEPETAPAPDPWPSGPGFGAELTPGPTAPHVPDHVEVVFSDALTRDTAFADTYADPWADPDPDAPDTPSELDVAVGGPDEDLPIAAAAADASAASDDDLAVAAEDDGALPDGPVDLEPADDPYATATHVPLEPDPEDVTLAEADAEIDAVVEPVAEPELQPEDVAAAEPDAEDVPVAEAEAKPEDVAVVDGEAEPEDVAVVDGEAEPEDIAIVDAETEPAAEPDAVTAVDAEADASGEREPEEAEAGEVAAAEDVEDPENVEDPEDVDDPENVEDGASGTEPDRVLDPAMLAIPAAAPLRQPEEIRLGTPGPDAVPVVVLYDEEEGLTVADGTPSPAAWQPEPTEPVLAWQGAAKDADVYAEMASLVAASGELLADEPEGLEETDVVDDVDDMPSVDLSQVFGESRAPAAVAFAASLDEAEQGLGTNDEDVLEGEVADDDLLAERGPVPEPRAHIEVVDLRDQLPEDPRSTPSLVRALLARSHEVYGVSEAGALVVADALARTGAGAGALLLPDGDAWRVAAGEGLRRLEHRYVLGADSWLVTTIASRHKGVIIDRTDVARRPLAGAPLAAHKHLVAAPVRAVAGILLIARDDDPAFGERDLLSLSRLAEASAGILASALDARQLARLLGDIRDQDDRAAADRIDYGL